MEKQDQKDILMVVDSNALVHRAYHAIPNLTSPSGILTNAVYGYFLILLKAIEEIKPKYIVATFDVAAKTFRHEMFEEYKATRIKSPDNLYAQIPIVKEILTDMNINILEAEGYEADDVIGTVATKAKKEKNLEVVIVTGDLDTLQLIDSNVKVWTLKTGISQSFLYDHTAFVNRYGLEPNQFVDYKGLKGDASDNIPGVSGIGDKTAKELILKHHSIEQLLKDSKKIVDDPLIHDKDKKIYIKMLANKDEALFSKQLSSIDLDVPIDFKISDSLYEVKDIKKLKETLKKYGFFSLIKKIEIQNMPVVSSKQSNPLDYKTIEIKDIKEVNEYLKDTNFIYLLLDPDNNLHFSIIKDNENLVFKLDKSLISDLKIPKTTLVSYDAKQIYRIYPDVFNDFLFEDIKIMTWLVDPEKKDYSLSSIAKVYMREKKDQYNFFDNFETSDLVAILPEIYQKILKKINENNLDTVWNTIEKPLIRVINNMEKNGIGLDIKYLDTLIIKFQPEINDLETEIYKLAGKEFNINSPKQIAEVLFEDLEIDTHGLAKTSVNRTVSTNSNELEKIKDDHPIIENILRYRELTKLVTGFITPLPTYISPKDQKIHAVFQQTGTATGRLSSDSPNLQNIPIKKDYGPLIRQAFIPSSGYSFVSFDYSQMELRIAAFLSQDDAMIESFKEGKDFHTYTASLVFDLPYEKVSKEQRNQVKVLNFGIVYGMGSKAYAQQAKITKEEAKTYIDEYFAHYYKLKTYLEKLKEDARSRGFCETIFGRRRSLPFAGVISREGAEQDRIAINMPIQGSAADLIKLSMVKIFNHLSEENLLGKVKLVAQIHDELLFEIQSDILDKVIPDIQKHLEENELNILLKVNMDIGQNWGEVS